MKYRTPIIDRIAQDVEDETSKAHFNVADWTRVYENSEYVTELVNILNCAGIVFDDLAYPTITTIPTIAEFNAMLANIERLRLACGMDGLTAIKDDWKEGTASDAPDYLNANEWERVIDIILNSIGASVDYQIHCGVSATGQPRFYQARWRIFTGYIPDAGSPTRKPRTGIATCGVGLTRNNSYRRYT